MAQTAWAATRTKNSYFAAQFRRLLRRAPQKALIAVAHSLLGVIWHMLKRNTPYRELGTDYFQRRDQQNLIRRKLENLGFRVQLEPIT